MWRASLSENALAGIAATDKFVFVADRELDDTIDALRCLDAASGEEVWGFRTPTTAQFDYGNSSRATPWIQDGHVFFLGASGQLSALALTNGELQWQFDLREEFHVTENLKWGYCGSPLVVGNKLFVQPGGAKASLVALKPVTGEPIWKSPGNPSSYGSLNAAKLGGRWQIVGHDATTLGGWDVATGERLWSITPRFAGDFNVPTPLIYQDHLIVVTENNGTRMFRFDADGRIDPQPMAVCLDLNPDTHTPVIVGDRMFGVAHELLCLDLRDNLKVLWQGRDDVFHKHVNVMASPDRLLATTEDGELLLVDAAAPEFRVLSRQKLFADESGLLSHPALVGSKLYIRGSRELLCVDLLDSEK